MSKIFQWPLGRLDKDKRITVPSGYKILSSGSDGNDNLSLWVMVNPEESKMVDLKCSVYLTGEYFDYNPSSVFFGTTEINGYLFHVFVMEADDEA